MPPKRTPDSLKLIKGTARPDRMNPDAPAPNKGITHPPEWLADRAAELFMQLSAILNGMGVASPDDVHALAMLSSRLEQVEILTVTIEDSGFTYLSEGGLWKARPEVAMRAEAMRHAQSLLNEFGLTPAARSKVSAGQPQEENPFAALEREFGF